MKPPRVGLPDKRSWGLLIYVVFAGFLFLSPYQQRAGWLEWTLTAAGVAAFVGLYLCVFGPRGRRLLWVTAGDVLLGVLFAPFNPAASIFFVYAASFVPFALRGRTWQAAVAILLLVTILGAESWMLQLRPAFWAIGVGYSVVIGAANIWTAQQAMTNERLRLAQDEVERLAKLAERERIARDLHDVLGHTLSVIIVKSELAGRLLDSDLSRARAEITSVEQVSRQALAEVREAVRGYRTVGILAEFERATSTLETAGVAVECRSNTIAMTPAQEGMLALVLREAVTNIVRHAGARTCRLRLEEMNGACRLEIHDDGRGGPHVEGYGIRGMRERIEALGGTLTQEDQAGIKLTVTVPLARPGNVSS